jgi:hypothetical protein
MVALRVVLKILAGFALMATFATSAMANCGCGYGNYGYGYGHGNYGYGYGHAHGAYWAYPYGPPRYMVNQGPNYTGPNVVNFAPRHYDPGYVNTQAYPYVGRYRYGVRVHRRYAMMHRPYGMRAYVRHHRPYGWRPRTAPMQWR